MTAENKLITKIENWDHKTFLFLYESDFLRKTKKFAQIYSFFGNYIFWGAVWLAMGIYGYITKDYYLFVLFTGGFDQSIFIHVLIRYKLVNRNRPYMNIDGVEQHDELIKEHKSFPSGHVTFFLFFGIIFAFYFNSWNMLFMFIALDIIMAITRLILGVHYPTDVLFGFVFAFLYALLYLGLTYVYWIEFYYWLGKILAPLNPLSW